MVSAAEVIGQPVSGRAVLANRPFLIYLVTAIISSAGSFMQSISVPFVLRDITDSNTWIGIGTMAWMVPSLVVGPVSGIVSDRFDRRLVLIWSNVVQLVGAAGLFVIGLTDALRPWPIVGLVTIGGLGAGFQYTAAQSIAAVILPPEHLLHGVRLNAMGFTVARAVGPAVAGLVLGFWGPTAAFGINAATYLVFIAALCVIRTRVVPLASGDTDWWRRFVEGARYVSRRPALRLVVITAFIGAFFGQSMMQLAAGLAKDGFHVGGAALGALVAVYGTGSTVASVALVRGGDRLPRSRMATIGLSLFGIGLTLAIGTPWYPVGLVGFLVAGTAHGFTNISLNTSVQAQVHEEFRGRALSLFLMALLAGMPFGALAGGALGDVIGLRITLGIFAVTVTAYLTFVVTRRDRLAILDGDEPIELDEAPALAPKIAG
ncbi:MAG TPA: MFS transporter [Acidimicrobiales bacterium]